MSLYLLIRHDIDILELIGPVSFSLLSNQQLCFPIKSNDDATLRGIVLALYNRALADVLVHVYLPFFDYSIYIVA
jgi:hypothetical protein